MVSEKFCVFGESDKKTHFSQPDLNQAETLFAWSTVPHLGFDPEVEQRKCATGEEVTNALPLNTAAVCHALTWLKGGTQPLIAALSDILQSGDQLSLSVVHSAKGSGLPCARKHTE